MARIFSLRSTLSLQVLIAFLGGYAGCSSDTAHDQELVSSRQHAYTSVPYRGVNLAGAEFAADVWGNGTFPGSNGSNYIYPSASEADYYMAKGMNTFRIPFRWERLQRTLNGSFDAGESSLLTNLVNGLTAKGAYVIIDPHNYGRYMTNIIGSAAVTNANFADFWTKLANLFKSNSKVIFAVMNEPHDMTSTADWVTSANAAISAIRSTGATQLVLVQGYHWSGAHAWSRSDIYGTANAVAMLDIRDPGNNFAYEAHQYLDADYSGTSDQCQSTTIGSQSLQNFTDWLKANNFRGFVSEFGGGRNDTCYAAIKDEVAHIMNNPSVYLGWTYWSGGPWWGDYILTLEPSNGVDRPQMASLTPYLTPATGTGGSSSTGGATSTGGTAAGGSSSGGSTSITGVTGSLSLTNDWGSGYCASVTISNGSSSTVTSWTAVIELNQAALQNLWSGTYTVSGSRLTVKPADFNGTISPGSSVNFGYCANGTGTNYRPTLVSVTGSGASLGTGGAPGTGGAAATGGARPTGGAAATGGTPATGGARPTGGTPATGGARPTGGTPATGGARPTGGTPATGGSSSSAEPCVPSKTVAGGQSGNFNTSGAYCFRTADTINGWGCSNFDGRTVLVNDVAKSCGGLPMPTKYNGYYYFEVSAGAYPWASIYWW